MRIVNLANRMNIFRRNRWGADSQALRGQAYDGGNIAPVWLKSKKNLRVISPQGLEARSLLTRWVRFREFEVEQFAGSSWKLLYNSSFWVMSQAKKLGFFLWQSNRPTDVSVGLWYCSKRCRH